MLGEQEHQTCNACIKTQTTPGVGLTPLIQEEYETKLEALSNLVTGVSATTFENFEAAGSVSLPITRGVIEALRDEPDQDILARRLASEVALSSVLEKALLLQRTLFTGRKEPNVAANQIALDAVTRETELLPQEIENLKTELELRRGLARNSPMAIIERHGVRSAGSRGIFQGDTDRNRLDTIESLDQHARDAGRQSFARQPPDCTSFLPREAPPRTAEPSAGALCVRGTKVGIHLFNLIRSVLSLLPFGPV